MRYTITQAWFKYLLVLSLLVVAFFLRFEHLLARVFHIDEYISMLAAQMTALKGVPVFPSGLFYSQGLLVSYLTAPFLRLAGFSEEVARWPAVLIGVVTVACYYLVGSRMSKSQAAGLFVLAFAALDVTMILWSARVRMYALAGLLMLLALFFLAQGTFLNPHRRYRLAAVVCFLGAILAHSVSIAVLPVWGIAVIICVWLGHEKFQLNWYRQKSVGLEVVVSLLLLTLGLGFGVVGQIPFLSPGSGAGDGGSSVMGVLSKFLEPGVSWQRVDDYLYYYTSLSYWPLILLGGLAFLRALVSAVRGRLTRRDLATLFLGLVFLLTIAELSLVLTHTWRKTRYLFILCQAPFLLLAADGLARLIEYGSRLFAEQAKSAALIGTLLGIIGILVFWSNPAIAVASMQGTGGYDTAFMWVKENWQEGDQVMTVHPSAAYLYLDRSDYYATQGTARVLLDEESEELIDRYVGSKLLDSVDALNKVVSEDGRLWFVVDKNRLFNRYNSLFIQQMFSQMDVAYHSGGVFVFLSRPYPQPVPTEPHVMVDANFSDLIELGGYSLDLGAIAPDGTVQLGLYWQPGTSQLSKAYKVFVQLRNEEGQIAAQADHFIFESLLTASTLAQMTVQGEWLRDTADLTVPQELPSGTYRLLVGLYDPDTFERVPLVADQSGENAVILETVSIP